MLKICSIVDKTGTALDRLAHGVAPYHKNLDYVVLDCHPKRPSPEQLQKIVQECRTADIIDAQYYRTIEMLRQRFAWLKDIPTVLTHNNPYSIGESDWNDYQAVIGNNRTIYKSLGTITNSRLEHIPLAVDPYFWTFNDDYKANRSVIMVANRIEGKKGILEVAKACKELEVKMYLVGAISDPDYWKQVMDTGIVHFAQQISDEDLRDLYHTAGLLVCNSVDNFESGTLPILEAISCGVPVLTREIGHVPDFKTEDNLFINHKQPDDIENLSNLISSALSDKKKLESMRHDAWMSIKHMNFDRRAYSYQRLYRELLPMKPATVIVPVAEKENITRECLQAIANQTHTNIEVIVADDGEQDQKKLIDDFAKTVSIPVRYTRLGGEGYNLAEGRNLASIEATSDILIFNDQRQVMEPDCVENFVSNIKPKTWLWGNKGHKKDFVENLSCIYRDDFITFGMFNERCDRYGALSQETRSRARRQLINLEYCESAKATPVGKSSNRWRKKIEVMESKNWLWKVGLN